MNREPLAAGGRTRGAMLLGVAVLMVVAAWLASLAGAAFARWAGPVRLSLPGQLATYPAIGVDRRGDSVAVWDQADASGNYVIMSSSRATGGAWTLPMAISAQGQDSEFPVIAGDRSGAAVAVWESGARTHSASNALPSIQASVRSSSTAPWRKPVQISGDGVAAYAAKVGIDAEGRAVAIWNSAENGRNNIEIATGSAATGIWARPVLLASNRKHLLVNPEIAVDARGDVIAAWKVWLRGGILSPGGITGAIVAALRPAGRSWLQPGNVGSEVEPTGQGSASFEFPGPRVALDANGDAIVVWQGRQDRGRILAEASVSRAGRRWQKPRPISNGPALEPHVAMDARGDATVVWTGPKGSIVTSSEPSGGHNWSAPRTLSPGNPNVDPYPHVAVDGRGDAIATWDGYPARAAVRRGPNGAWHLPAKLDNGGVTQTAFALDGSAMVIWQHPSGHSIIIEAARYFG